ncbi:MAG: aerial mycelium formation protein [Angustibacter sp.]
MTTQPQDGGRRPIDRILTPSFVADVSTLDLAELRSRRALAEQEEVDLSYARRLLQGRLDLLRAEVDRRASGIAPTANRRTDSQLARDLGATLADANPRQDHGLGRHVLADPSRVGEHRRAAEQAVADVRASNPVVLADAELAAAILRLEEFEQQISENRHRVQVIMDRLTADMTRRYRDGEANVHDVLAAEQPRIGSA